MVYQPDRADGRLNLTASRPGRRDCYAELAIFFPSGGRSHRQYSSFHGRMARLSYYGWLDIEVYPTHAVVGYTSTHIYGSTPH